jgi:hypothetical protein
LKLICSRVNNCSPKPMKTRLSAVMFLSWLCLPNFQSTTNAQPVVTTLPANPVTPTNATLNGTVNPNGAVTTAYFQFGPTTNYGNVGTATVFPATNSTLAVPGFVVSTITGAAGTNWTQSTATNANWYSIASSSDGLRLVAVIAPGGTNIYTSTNAGTSWTPSSVPSANWQTVASSMDGRRLAAGIGGGGIYTSTNGGLTWAVSGASTQNWTAIASSSDGLRLAAVAGSVANIYTSTNGGATWTNSSVPALQWSAIASSSDGTRLAAAANALGLIFTSTNGGATFTQSSAPTNSYRAIASSSDGTRLAAAALGRGIYTSTNNGATWTLTSAPTFQLWISLASSFDGRRLIAGINNGGIYTSTDGGVTWTPSGATNASWWSIASSGDGTRIAAVVNGGGIFTSAGAASPLVPNKTFHYQLVGLSSAGMSLGSDLTFTTAAGFPTVTTLAASQVADTHASLNGTIDTGGLNTTAYFEYGLTPSYGAYSATNSLAATNTTLLVSSLIAGLSPYTVYQYRLVGINSGGTRMGDNLTFTTAASPPTVTTLPATAVTVSNATLNGTVNPKGGATLAYFQYGLTTNYGYLGGFSVLPTTNATLSMPGLVVNSLPGAAGTNWTQTSAPNTNWYSIAYSADGTRLAAVINGGGIWTSTNSGVTWQQTSAPSSFWYSIACSANGTRLAAASYSTGQIWTSTNSGGTWTLVFNAPGTNWNSIASSADGMRLVVSAVSGGIFTSTDGGVTWTQTSAPSAIWTVASSAGGTRLAAAADNGGIWTSTDGATWTLTSAPTNYWLSIASSADGMRLAAVQYNAGQIWTSTNGGLTWSQTSAPAGQWFSIASSADGMRLAAVINGGGIWSSADGGGTWAASDAPSAAWSTIASSGDGMRLAAGVSGGGIWTSVGTASNLQVGTLYNYRLVGFNSGGTGLGSNLTFITSPAVPSVSTHAASGITGTNCTLNGTVNPDGAATTAYFRYGLTTIYGSFSATNSLPATNTTFPVSDLISNLTANTTYHFQLVASNSLGIGLGSDLTFTTTAAAPTVTTLAATSITAANATLNGTVNPNWATTTAFFRYGLTTNYGSYSPTNTLPATNVVLSVSNLISNLAGSTTYHFQLVASNSAGTSLGGDLTFSTIAAVPTVTTLAAGGVTPTNATLNGSVNPNGAATTAYFRYGLTTNYGNYSATNALAATNINLSVSKLINNLTANTTYHFQLVASNSVGTSLGNDLTLTTVSGPLTNPYGLAVLADHPLGYWRLDETNGPVAHDYFSANSGFYTNALLGQAGYTNLDPHTAVKFGSFSNVNSYVGGVPIGFATAGNATFSIECWANSGAQTSDCGIITKGTGGSEQFNLDCGSTGHAFRFYVRDAAGGAHLANGTATPNNTWRHLVGVCDQANGKVILYVDGISNASGTITAGSGLLSSANATTFGSRQSSTNAYDLQYVGSLEEVAIYTNALSAARVLAHYQAATLATTPPPPVINSATVLSNGAFQLTFTNTNNVVFSVLSTTNLGLPASNWTMLGTTTNIGGGLHGFTDSAATNFWNRYYLLRFP